MKFIPKQSLKETTANPLDAHIETISADAAYKQAILAIVGSEGNAYNEYDQVLALEKDVEDKSLVELFHDTLVHFRDEEMGHASGIMSKIKQVSDMHDAYIKGEEEAEDGDEDKQVEKESITESLQEAVPTNRTYSSDALIEFLANRLNVTDEEYDELLELIGIDKQELQPEEVDNILSKLDLTPEQLTDIESRINNIEDPIVVRKTEFNDDMTSDASLIEDLIEKVSTVAAKEGLANLKSKLLGLQYDGSADTGWRIDHSMLYGGKNTTKNIIA